MATPGTLRRPLSPPARKGPAIIAHCAGYTAALAAAAAETHADFIEVDLWVHNGRFEARHERRFPAHLPILFEKWYLRFAPRTPFGLADLMEAVDDQTGLFLDLKNGGARAAELVARSMDESGRHHRIVASAQEWNALRALRARSPAVDLFYSIDVQAKLDLFLSVLRRDVRPMGVSCRHTLLNQETVAELHGRGLKVVAWTVDSDDRAAELAAMGVEGITTHRVAELRERLGCE